MLCELREAYRQGSEGHFVDGALAMTSADWGFDLRRISVPVHLWHGDDDRLVSRGMARQLAAAIPGCIAHLVPAAGHLLLERPGVVEEICSVLNRGAA